VNTVGVVSMGRRAEVLTLQVNELSFWAPVHA